MKNDFQILKSKNSEEWIRYNINEADNGSIIWFGFAKQITEQIHLVAIHILIDIQDP